ncbi:MAG TPA: DUF2946 family protein [Burkholderiales bacterium]|nr:DUF2946 family protein [Burkholderiales bacterium]
MLTRSRKQFVALIALFAVIFTALMPATSSMTRTLTNADVVALGGICSTAHEGEPAVPADRAATHGHCAFCSLGTPLVPGHRADALLAVLDVPSLVHPLLRNDTLPRDVVAFHPLSPRAPPRAI